MLRNTPPTRILAVDPGYERLGVAILEKGFDGRELLVFSTCITTSPKSPMVERLQHVGLELRRIINEYSPSEFAIETLFFSKNQKTALAVAETRGVALYEAVNAGLAVHEYAPVEVKVATTGYGKSDKRQMMAMVSRIFPAAAALTSDDEVDAIAVGMTHFASAKMRRLR